MVNTGRGPTGIPEQGVLPPLAFRGGWRRYGVAAPDPDAPITCLTYQSLCQIQDPGVALANAAERRWALDRAGPLGSRSQRSTTKAAKPLHALTPLRPNYPVGRREFPLDMTSRQWRHVHLTSCPAMSRAVVGRRWSSGLSGRRQLL